MLEVLTNHNFWLLIGCYWIFSAAVGAMPPVEAGDTKKYQFFYVFLHTLAGNLKDAFGDKITGLASKTAPDKTA